MELFAYAGLKTPCLSLVELGMRVNVLVGTEVTIDFLMTTLAFLLGLFVSVSSLIMLIEDC